MVVFADEVHVFFAAVVVRRLSTCRDVSRLEPQPTLFERHAFYCTTRHQLAIFHSLFTWSCFLQ